MRLPALLAAASDSIPHAASPCAALLNFGGGYVVALATVMRGNAARRAPNDGPHLANCEKAASLTEASGLRSSGTSDVPLMSSPRDFGAGSPARSTSVGYLAN